MSPPLHTCTAHVLHVLHVLHVFSARPIILFHPATRNQAGNRTGMCHMCHLMVEKTGSVPSGFCCRCLFRIPESRSRRRQNQTAVTSIWISLHRRLSLSCAESIYHVEVQAMRYCMRGGTGQAPNGPAADSAPSGFRSLDFSPPRNERWASHVSRRTAARQARFNERLIFVLCGQCQRLPEPGSALDAKMGGLNHIGTLCFKGRRLSNRKAHGTPHIWHPARFFKICNHCKFFRAYSSPPSCLSGSSSAPRGGSL